MEDKNLLDKANDMLDKAEKNAENTIENAADASKDVVEKVVDKTVEIASDVVDTAKKAVEGVVDAGGVVVDKTAELASGAIETAGNVVDGAIDAGEAVINKTTELASDAAKMAGNVIGSAADSVSDSVEEGVSLFKKILPLLLALLLAVILYLFFQKGCQTNPNGVAAPTADSTENNIVSNAYDSATQAIVDGWKALGEMVKVTLPGGVEIEAPANGFEGKLVNFLNAKNADSIKTTWFDFDRLIFNSGSSELSPASDGQLNTLVQILNAYPTAKIKIGGYTDNTGTEATNIKVSGERAEAVKAALVAKGIAAERLNTEGYGPKHPVCPANDTEECKAKNRRVSIRIEKF